PLAEQLAPALRTSDGYRLLIHCLQTLGRPDEAGRALLEATRAFPADGELAMRAAVSLYEQDDYPAAAEAFRHVPRAAMDEPEVVARHAHALLATGQAEQALEIARGAYLKKPRGVPALILGLASLDHGDLAGAEEPLGRAAHSLDGKERSFAQGMLGLTAFWMGDLERARDLWRMLDDRAELAPHLLNYLAIAEATRGDGEGARALLERASTPDDPAALLARARVELLLGKPAQALAALDRIVEAPDASQPLIAAAHGRALRLLGRNADARAVLEPLTGKISGPAAAMALVDLGRMASDEGRHEDAAQIFERALACDPSSAEARQGLATAHERTAWRDSLAQSAQCQVEAAKAEAEAMRHAFCERERELVMLRARLAQTEREATDAEREAARARAEADRSRREGLREELETREAEATDRARETLRTAFGDALDQCPTGLLEALRVAETTYQKALYTELHPAAVAVLFAGALERGLYLLLVRPFDRSLSSEARAAFLKGAVRQLRAGRAEYIDRFVEAFDQDRKAKAPSLGEIARALARRREPHLAPFAAFLGAGHDAFFDALAAFVERAKEQLRDPVAHGRALELPQAELARFRQELLLDLAGTKRGALPGLLSAVSSKQ
ncbi:MAG: tetratricopeptide repeat protein, partial [Deltaproteobacteria bacterium]|nr:tetratricopeptide repeat protein [Deltaproteobacteria bacterium]